MVRRSPLLLLSGLALLVGSARTPGARADGPARRPNLVLFLVDDLGWRDTELPLEPAAHTPPTAFHTPNVLRLAERGMRFTDAYAAAPVCTPTRTSILTGRSPGRNRITYWTLHADQDTSARHPRLAPPAWRKEGLAPDPALLPERLRRAGYRTIHVGKAHFGAHGTPGADPTNLGFDVNVAGHASGGPASYLGTQGFSLAGREKKPERGPSVWDVPGLEAYHGQDVFLTDVLAGEACEAVRAAVADGVPFYLGFAPYAVHAPIMANAKHLDRYAELDPTEAAYATMVESVDEALGRLLDLLDELGVADDTVVVFTSDNGGLSAHARGGEPNTHNRPLRSGKGSAYEGGIRVPAVVSWPGVTAPGSVSEVPIVAQDLYPTLLAAAGVERGPADEALGPGDGRDLTPVLSGLSGAASSLERPLFWHQPHQWGAQGPGIEPFTAVRHGRYKLVYFHDGPRFELYDAIDDVGEERDLAPLRPDLVRELAAELDGWIERYDVQLSTELATDEPVPLPGVAFAWSRPEDRALLERAAACVPHPRQIAWQRRELAAFVHFGVNTFTDREWGTGTEDPALFAPTALDAASWVRAFADAGMRRVVLTAKHHDGFCLWPSAYTDHSVRSSPWRGGEGDVVREVRDACTALGLDFGVYLSPADLHEIERPGGTYGNGSPAVRSPIPTPLDGSAARGELVYEVDDYNRYFLNQLHELLTEYGPVHEVWLDGANPEPGTGQTYAYAAWYDLVRRLAPRAVIFGRGPDARWVGNEHGYGRESEWSVIPLERPAEEEVWLDRTAADLGSRERLRGAAAFHWYPAEADTSIRPGWFFHASQNAAVKPLDLLLDVYFSSVGRNCVLLLNVPPDPRGLLHETDVRRLADLGRHLAATFDTDRVPGARASASAETPAHPAADARDGDDDTYWTCAGGTDEPVLELAFPEPRTFGVVRLEEHLPSGQRIEAHVVEAAVYLGGPRKETRWLPIAEGTTVGARRLHRFPTVTASGLRIRILRSRLAPTLSEVGLHLEPER